MKKKVFLKFRKGKQRALLMDAIKKAGSEKRLVSLIKIPSASLYAYKHEIQPIPLERAKKLTRFLKFDFNKLKKEIRSTFVTYWSKEEIEFLFKNYLDMTAKEIANKLDRSVYSVKSKRKQLDLKKGPKYRWTREKVIISFNKFREELERTPTYQECGEKFGGMISAIHLIWGKYSTFLNSLGLDTKIKRWTKKECIREFEKLRKKTKGIPTQENLKECSGLINALLRRWRSYNTFLKELDLEPNFELKWSKQKCIVEFEKLMSGRKILLTIEELYKISPALVAAIYKYFSNYPSFIKKIGYNYDDKWQKWENLVIKICKKIHKNVVVKPRLKNNKQPDVAILQNNAYKIIIDAKLNSFTNSIMKDIKNYEFYCKKLEFWCLLGNKSLNIKDVKIRNANQIKQILKKHNEINLITEIENLKNDI